MTRGKLFVFAALMMLGAHGCGKDVDPAAVLDKAEAAYASIDTYKSEGTIISSIDTEGMKVDVETSFSMILKKPNLYRITWTQQNKAMPGMIQSGSVWSDGSQPYLYMGRMNAYAKMGNDEVALGAATGISGGAAITIPSMFLPAFKEQPSPIARLQDPRLERTGRIGNDDCYVISGPSSISKKETLWISKTSHLVVKHERSLEPPEGGIAMPEMTDEQLAQAITSTGGEVTEESKENMRKMIEQSRTRLETMKMTGSSTETHTNISSPELGAEDFKFTPPEDAILKESLFGDAFDPGAVQK